MLRPDFRTAFRKGVKGRGTPDPSVGSLAEKAGGEIPEGIPRLLYDPATPEEDEMWLRPDKNPPELRLFAGGETWALAFAAAVAEPSEPLYPDIALYPPLTPNG